MAKAIRYKDGTLMQPGTEGWELHHNPPKILKGPNATKSLDQHMKDLDDKWRKTEARVPAKDLDERGQMLEGRIPWDPVHLKQLTAERMAA